MFGISEAEAERMDPQQRYVLECVHMAMEDGGFTRKKLHGSNTGVYIGKKMVMNNLSYIYENTDNHKDQCVVTLTMLWANSADDKLMIFFSFFPENRILYISCRLSPFFLIFPTK